MNGYQNSSRSSTETNGNNVLNALSGAQLPLSDRAHLIDQMLRTSIDKNPPTLQKPRPAALGPPVDLSSLEYVEEYSHNLMCAICHNPYVRPLRLPCQHVFCSACFLDARNSHAQRESCPTCRERVSPGQLNSIPKIVELMLDDLIVKCPFSTSGCTEQMSRCLIQDHVDKYCGCVQVKCPYDDCGEKIQRRNLNHQRCLHKLVLCVTCGRSCKEIDFDSHCTTHDDERIVLCPSCATTVLGSDLRSHESSCPKATVPCIAATYGCDYRGKRASIIQHNATCPLAKLAPFLALQCLRLAQQELALKNLRRKNALLETTFDRIESFFTSLSVPTQVASDDQAHGVDVTFTGIASLILDMYERQHKDLDLATTMTELGRRMEILSDAQVVNHQVFNSKLLHTNRHVNAVEREMARLRRELSIYRQGTRVPESVGVATLEVSGLESSVARASADARMVNRLIPDFETSRPERIRTTPSDRQHMLFSRGPPLFNNRGFPAPCGRVGHLADRNETRSHRPRAGLRRLSPFSAIWSLHWPGMGRRQVQERSQAQDFANEDSNESRTETGNSASTGEPPYQIEEISEQHVNFSQQDPRPNQ